VRRPTAVALTLLATAGLAACGSSDKSSSATTPTAADTASQAAQFPKPQGRPISELLGSMQRGLILAPSVSVVHPGTNRYGFAIFDTARKQINAAPVALYISRQDGSGVRGPFLARSESLAVKPAFQSVTTASDPDAAKMVYVADVQFPRPGRYRVSGVARLDGRSVALDPFTADVTAGSGGMPLVGDKAPKLSTPTLASVGGDASKIETRSPADKDLLNTDLADVYGKKPVALLFATPALCQSRVCGPVVDIQAQVRAKVGDGKVAFIHNEIYQDNQVNKGLRPQPAAYRIPTEPWLFVLDRNGRVSTRIEGAFSAAELERAVAKVSG
jgi:hypothetical protein